MQGKESLNYADLLNNIGLLDYDMGKYANAELLFLEAIAVVERNLMEKTTQYASMISNLGMLYYSMGNYEKAEKLYLEAKAIRKKHWGTNIQNMQQALTIWQFCTMLWEIMLNLSRFTWKQ
ncbi:MAG: tetratricopeptide repeat protein [Lewinellaceae bacterium]|nr:tetratricopeptide repeat protein [Lewinellaceae bacterium]